jgi:hypothetical protein
MATFQTLYDARCNSEGIPQYWKPQTLTATPLPITTDNVPEILERILASAIVLEVDVASYLAEGWKADIKGKNSIPEVAEKLIESNIPDESVHLAQFKKAIAVYPVREQYLREAEQLSQQWQDDEGHPLLKATLLEIGVFVPCSLPVLLRAGGLSLGWVGQKVSQDEQRHQAVGRAVCNRLKLDSYKPSVSLNALRKSTIRWIVGDGYLKHWKIGLEWFLEQSDLVVSGQIAPALSKWSNVPRYRPPFESENRFQGY